MRTKFYVVPEAGAAATWEQMKAGVSPMERLAAMCRDYERSATSLVRQGMYLWWSALLTGCTFPFWVGR